MARQVVSCMEGAEKIGDLGKALKRSRIDDTSFTLLREYPMRISKYHFQKLRAICLEQKNKDKTHLLNIIANFIIAFVAILAYIEYKTLNGITVDTALYNMDISIYDMIAKDDKPYLLSYMYAHKGDNETEYDYSLRSLNALMPTDIQYNNINDIKSIGAFYNTHICSPAHNVSDNGRLLNTIAVCERILYLVYNVYLSYEAGVIDERQLRDYLSYIDNYGSSITFLSAIYIGHRFGYFSVEFAKVLQEQLSKNKIVMALYPEMLRKKWLDDLNERRRS